MVIPVCKTNDIWENMKMVSYSVNLEDIRVDTMSVGYNQTVEREEFKFLSSTFSLFYLNKMQ